MDISSQSLFNGWVTLFEFSEEEVEFLRQDEEKYSIMRAFLVKRGCSVSVAPRHELIRLFAREKMRLRGLTVTDDISKEELQAIVNRLR